MKRITQKELEVFLRKHKLWLDNKEGGSRANLSGANLSRANLSGADLSRANLSGANLSGADLSGADLSGADLSGANLSWADLSWANLSGANLSRANLSGADLSGADLSGANLSRANLSGANLSGANLSRADLDYSVLPLWCGSLKANFDDRQLTQIAYHLVKAGLNSDNASDETKAELAKLIDLANKFHRVEECGVIPPYKEGTSDEE